MILTLTANPSIDRTIELPAPLVRGEVQLVTRTTDQGGGKGVNISRAAVTAGIPSVAVLPAARDDAFVTELLAAGIDCRPTRPAGPVRVNVTITEPDGTTTKLNAPGSALGPEHLDELTGALLRRAPGSLWTVMAGSLPAGTPASFYAEVVRRLRGVAPRVAVDTSGAPLSALVDALPEAAPDLMKPNGLELASVAGGDPDEIEADPALAAEAARVLVGRGVGAVLATLGGNGAVLVTADGAWHATPPPTEVVSTVGAGDSSLFGYLLGDVRGLDPAGRLALAVGYGSAAAGLPGTTIPSPDQVRSDDVSVRRLTTTGK